MKMYEKTVKVNDTFVRSVEIYKNNADCIGTPYYEAYMIIGNQFTIIAKATFFYDGEIMYDFSYTNDFLNLKNNYNKLAQNIYYENTDKFFKYIISVEFDNLKKKISKTIKNLYKKESKKVVA